MPLGQIQGPSGKYQIRWMERRCRLKLTLGRKLLQYYSTPTKELDPQNSHYQLSHCCPQMLKV
jgi:hypothetical protein